MRLKDKVAILTGAGSGIGKATAIMFADQGARIVLAGRRVEPLKGVADTVRSRGGSAVYRSTDVSDPAQVQALIRNGGGSIIVTSSMVGMTGVRNRIPYGASKGGVNQLVKCLAIDCAEHRVRVNAICPGRVMSEMVAHLKGKDGEWGGITKPYPLGIRGEPKHVAYAAIYLASDESEWVTGVLLPVEGGYLTY